MYLLTVNSAQDFGDEVLTVQTEDALYFCSWLCLREQLVKDGVPADVIADGHEWLMPRYEGDEPSPGRIMRTQLQWGLYYGEAGDSCEFCPSCEVLVITGTEHCICRGPQHPQPDPAELVGALMGDDPDEWRV